MGLSHDNRLDNFHLSSRHDDLLSILGFDERELQNSKKNKGSPVGHTSTDLQEDDVESLVSSTRSFGELMNRDSNMLMNSIHQVVGLNNSNLYYEMITNQFINDYLEESALFKSM